MKALVYEKYTDNNDFESILQIKDIPEPIAKSNEVLFRVKAAALNYDDIWGMRGKPLAVPLPHISGTDAAGEVIAVGEDVKNIKVGDIGEHRADLFVDKREHPFHNIITDSVGVSASHEQIIGSVFCPQVF